MKTYKKVHLLAAIFQTQQISEMQMKINPQGLLTAMLRLLSMSGLKQAQLFLHFTFQSEVLAGRELSQGMDKLDS